MKRHSQSKKAKENFLKTSIIALLMCAEPKRVFTKEELSDLLSLNSRDVRREVAELANYVAVIGLSNRKGYQALSIKDDDSEKTLVEFLDLIDHQLKELRSRVTNIKARMKPLIALRSVIEKKLQEGGAKSGLSSEGNNDSQKEQL